MGFLSAFVWSPVEHELCHEQALENLARARQDAREFGTRHRDEIRERVREFRRLEEELRNATTNVCPSSSPIISLFLPAKLLTGPDSPPSALDVPQKVLDQVIVCPRIYILPVVS